MAIPSGYTALDFVGFTDKGTYANNITYVKNDLAHYGGDIWKCLVDNTIGVTPSEGVNWTLWIGAPTNLVERIIAPLETNPATVAYAVGRQIIYDDWLWEVIAPIAVGDSLIDYAVDPTNANIKKSPSVETQVLAIKNGLGTAAAKDFTTSVTSGSADLVTSGAVYSEVDAVSTALTNVESKLNNNYVLKSSTSVKVTGNGVKTTQTLMKELHEALNTYLANNPTLYIKPTLLLLGASRFVLVYPYGFLKGSYAYGIIGNGIGVDATNTYCRYCNLASDLASNTFYTSTNTATPVSQASVVPANGTDFILYFDAYEKIST